VENGIPGSIVNTATVGVPTGVHELVPEDNASSTTTPLDLSGVLFMDGFESGDTTAWSTTVP
jgi:hypothetical protein